VRTDLLRRRLPKVLAGTAFLLALAGSVISGRPSEQALTLALASFGCSWLLGRALGLVLTGALGGRPGTDGEPSPDDDTEPSNEERG